ncbi:MAG: ABC transporter permease [Anaerolineae bacterium]|nr:ABC transporter permease [Anaerolineae bacterium]
MVMSWLRRLPPTLIIGMMILAFYLTVAITARYWAPYTHNKIGVGIPFSKPSNDHYFGTDQLGRDVFSRVVLGADDVLILAISSTLVATVIGGLVGLLSGLVGGWFDQLLMRAFDALIGIPFLVLALLIIAAAGSELSGDTRLLIMVVAVVYAPRTARIARAVAIDLVTRDFVTVARARGESVFSIVWRELTPNAIGALLVEFGVRAGYAPIFIGSLSFLGFGVRPPTPEWGLMIAENRAAIFVVPMVVFAPAGALAGLVIGLNLFTDGLARWIGRSQGAASG